MTRYCKAVVKGKVICEKVELADTFFRRFMAPLTH